MGIKRRICLLFCLLYSILPICSGITLPASAATTISNGIYYIKNTYSGKYLSPEFDDYTADARVWQRSKVTTHPNRLVQLWKVTSVGNGYYSIRPMNNPLRALYAEEEYTDVTLPTVGAYDSSTMAQKWLILSSDDGYIIKSDSFSYKLLSLKSDTSSEGAIVAVRADENKARQRWEFEPVTLSTGIQLYSSTTMQPLTSPTIYLQPNVHTTMSEMGLFPVLYSPYTNEQIFTYDSTASGAIPESDGSICGYPGVGATITIKATVNGTTVSTSYTLRVWEILEGTYFIFNRKSGMVVDVPDKQYTKDPIMEDGTQLIQNSHEGSIAQRWVIEYASGGRYTIKSLNSDSTEYYMGINQNGGNAIVLQAQTDSAAPQYWRILTTNIGGCYRFVPDTGESNSLSMKVSGSSTVENASLIQAAYTNDTDYGDQWQLQRVVYQVKHYYDLTIPSTMYIDAFTDALNFANRFFSKNFNIEFEAIETPTLVTTTPADDCPLGLFKACTTSSCGTDCLSHHKNTENIANWLLQQPRTDTQVNVLWSVRGPVSCYETSTGEHHLETENGYPTRGLVYAHKPAVQILSLPSGDFNEERASMCYTLTHELSHTLRMIDVDILEHDELCLMYAKMIEFPSSEDPDKVEMLNNKGYYDYYFNVVNGKIRGICSNCLSIMRPRVCNSLLTND